MEGKKLQVTDAYPDGIGYRTLDVLICCNLLDTLGWK